MTETSNNPTPLELAPAALVIPLKVTLGNQSYRIRHHLRPPSADDWFAYDAALAMAIEELPARMSAAAGKPAAAGKFDREAELPEESLPEAGPAWGGAGYKLELRSVEAAALLWDRLALGVEGYSLPAPVGLPEVPQAESAARQCWASRVPLAHKEAAVRALTLVAPANYTAENVSPSLLPALGSVAGFPLQAEQVAVVLEAIVAGCAYPRLVHTFRMPSADDERVYRRLLAESLIVRGSRLTRTLIPSRLPALCRLYDRLIVAVDGYTLHSQAITDRQALIAHMDAWHKRTAVQTLFGDATESIAAEVPHEHE